MLRLSLASLCLLPFALQSAELIGPSDVYQVGVAQVEITPTHPIRLNGFGGRRTESEGVYARLYARALSISASSKEPVLLITLDVLGIPDDLRAELVRRFAKHGIPADRIAITATHTHTGPMLKGANVTLFGTPIPPEHLANIDKYTAVFLDKVEEAGVAALKNTMASTLTWAIGRATFAMNRRTAGGPVDHDLPVLFVHAYPTRKVRAVYASYACHCVTLAMNKLGGDWAGYAVEEIESAFPGAVALMSVGCGADSNPTSKVGDTLEVARLQGREIAQEVKRLSQSHRTPIVGKVTTAFQRIDLPLAPLPTREQWEERAKRNDATGHHARETVKKLDRKDELPTKIDYPIQSWQFGDALAMTFLPGEVVVDFSLRLKRELDGQRLWLNAYSNGAPGYIPSERILKEGGYEGGGAMIYYDVPAPFKPGLEERIVDVVKEQQKAFAPKFDAARVTSMPRSPQQSLAAIKTNEDLVVELIAAEPLVDSPVFIDFGPDGKLWVCEMIDYPQGKAPGGRISFLADHARFPGQLQRTTFLDGIPFPTGVKVWRKGVLVCAAPDILYAEDTDGDGKADLVKKLFSGFGTGNYQARVNGLEYGLDGWVYGSCGLAGGTITSFTGKKYALGNRDFRIKPDTGEIEAVSGSSQQGRVRDDWGNWFGCDNSTLIRHYPLEEHYIKRNPHVPTPPTSVFVPADPNPNKLFPISTAQRFALSGPPGNVTAACGLCIYRDDLLGKDYRGNAFTCEPVNSLVHRLKLTPKGCTFEGHRPADEQDREFLASTDPWFRPVQVTTGPDGCLWIVDMYRHVIEHPVWIPEADRKKLDLRAGAGMGRIYRVRPKATEPRKCESLPTDVKKLEPFLSTPNGWQRDAVCHLYESCTDPPRRRDEVPAAFHAMLSEPWEFHPHGDKTLVDHPVAGPRRWMIRYMESDLPEKDFFGALFAAKRFDPDSFVRMQVAYTLGAWNDGKAATALGEMAVKDAGDPYILAAVMSSLNENNLAGVIDAVFAEAKEAGPPPKLAAQFVALVKAMKHEAGRVALMKKATEPVGGKYQGWQYAIVAEAISGGVGDPATAKVVEAARGVVRDDKAAIADRMLCLQLVGIEDRDLLRDLISPVSAPAMREAAVTRLIKLADDTLLLGGWKSHPPTTRTQILDGLLARKEGPAALLDAVEKKTIAAGEIDAGRRQRLLTHADKGIQSRAAKAFDGAVNADRAKVIAAYADNPSKGDAAKGKTVFTRVCAACHKLGDVGHAVGPDLGQIANRTPAYLLQEILDPNRNLDARYLEYQAVTKAERSVSGLLAGESATSITLRGQQAKDETLLRTDIDELRASGKSLMPEGIEKDVTKADMADLLAFLTAVKAPPKVLAGNTPTPVKEVGGSFTFRAEHAAVYGNSLLFEAEFRNIGYWNHAGDRVEWSFNAPKAGSYDVYLDYACAADSAGNALVIEGVDPAVTWKVMSTGTWSQYRTVKVGTVKVPAGDGRLIVRSAGEINNALLDLRSVLLQPQGVPLASTPPDVANAIRDLAAGITDTKEEYRRIPQIWQHAIAVGKRNDSKELLAVLDASLPTDTLRDWQAVVIGGGIVNGLTQAGVWPGERIRKLLDDDPKRQAAWTKAITDSFAMAENEKVPHGTRYDALRMVALAPPKLAVPALVKHLGKDAHPELQMGAVSGLGDVTDPSADAALAKALPDLAQANRKLAIDALLRTPERAKRLRGLLEAGTAKPEWLTPEQQKRLGN